MQINTNGKRNITLDFDAPKKFKLKKDGAEIPYIRTGKNSFRLGRNIDGVLDLEEVIEQPRIVKPMQLQAQQMALVNPNDVLLINQAAQQLEVEQNILSETQKRAEQTQAYLDIQQQKINESVLSVQGLETDNAERITATENGIFNLAGNLATVEQNLVDGIGVVNNELQEHKTAENPHGITKETIGLNKVNNTSDLDKPISKAVQSALDEKADKDEIQAIRDELGEYQEKNDRFTNALSNYTGGLAGNQLPNGGLTGQILAKRSDMSGDAEWVDSSASITIDDELSLESENPVQNKVITSNITALQTSKQDTLVSGTNIKTINNTSILGSGNIDIQGGGSYTAGTGIDITNNVIKVTSDISTGAELGATAIQPADLASVATSGSYNDLSNKPTIPTVNNATLTIQKNGSNVATFTANASSNVTANISVPTVDQTYSASSTNAQSGVAVASAISTKADSSTVSNINSRVTTIESEIPAQASSSNQLADKNFVNSSIATNTANFIGTFNSVAELEAYSGAKDDNDYAFVISTDAAGNTLYNRYKWNGTAWLFEYALNNSSFTAAQWAAINSGATTANIGQIATKADDNAVVHLSGSETITGTKTFNSEIYSTTDNTINRTTTQGNASVRMFDHNSAVYTRVRSINNNASTPKETYLDVIAHQDGTTQIDIYADNIYAHTPNTYDITDQIATTAFVKNVLDTLYPTGSIYIGTQSTCPLAMLLPDSTWELISAGRVLQGADSGHTAGTTIEAGLPNITGYFGFGNISNVSYPYAVTEASGSFTGTNTTVVANVGTNSVPGHSSIVDFNASRSSSIYGNSSTVQPPAYCVNIWRRTA